MSDIPQNTKPRNGSAPFFTHSSEELLDIIGSVRPQRDWPSLHPAETMLISGIRILSRYVGNGESTWPVNDPLLTELVEVCRCGDPADAQSEEYMLVWRDVVIHYYKHIKRSCAISRAMDFAEVEQALSEIAAAFEEHHLRLTGTDPKLPLAKNAKIQKITREHATLVEQKRTLMEYLERKHGQPRIGSDETPSEPTSD